MSSNTLLVTAAKLALKEEVNKAWPITMSAITLALSQWHQQQWVSAFFLLPDYMKNYWKMIVKNSFQVDLFGTDYFESVEGYYLLRHKHIFIILSLIFSIIAS
jgi:hypothetical protein